MLRHTNPSPYFGSIRKASGLIATVEVRSGASQPTAVSQLQVESIMPRLGKAKAGAALNIAGGWSEPDGGWGPTAFG